MRFGGSAPWACARVCSGGETHRILGPGLPPLLLPHTHTLTHPPTTGATTRPTPAPAERTRGTGRPSSSADDDDEDRGRLMKSFVFGAANAPRKFAPYLQAGDPRGISIPSAGEHIYIYVPKQTEYPADGIEFTRDYGGGAYTRDNIINTCVCVCVHACVGIYSPGEVRNRKCVCTPVCGARSVREPGSQ